MGKKRRNKRNKAKNNVHHTQQPQSLQSETQLESNLQQSNNITSKCLIEEQTPVQKTPLKSIARTTRSHSLDFRNNINEKRTNNAFLTPKTRKQSFNLRETMNSTNLSHIFDYNINNRFTKNINASKSAIFLSTAEKMNTECMKCRVRAKSSMPKLHSPGIEKIPLHTSVGVQTSFPNSLEKSSNKNTYSFAHIFESPKPFININDTSTFAPNFQLSSTPIINLRKSDNILKDLLQNCVNKTSEFDQSSPKTPNMQTILMNPKKFMLNKKSVSPRKFRPLQNFFKSNQHRFSNKQCSTVVPKSFTPIKKSLVLENSGATTFLGFSRVENVVGGTYGRFMAKYRRFHVKYVSQWTQRFFAFCNWLGVTVKKGLTSIYPLCTAHERPISPVAPPSVTAHDQSKTATEVTELRTALSLARAELDALVTRVERLESEGRHIVCSSDAHDRNEDDRLAKCFDGLREELKGFNKELCDAVRNAAHASRASIVDEVQKNVAEQLSSTLIPAITSNIRSTLEERNVTSTSSLSTPFNPIPPIIPKPPPLPPRVPVAPPPPPPPPMPPMENTPPGRAGKSLKLRTTNVGVSLKGVTDSGSVVGGDKKRPVISVDDILKVKLRKPMEKIRRSSQPVVSTDILRQVKLRPATRSGSVSEAMVTPLNTLGDALSPASALEQVLIGRPARRASVSDTQEGGTSDATAHSKGGASGVSANHVSRVKRLRRVGGYSFDFDFNSRRNLFNQLATNSGSSSSGWSPRERRERPR